MFFDFYLYFLEKITILFYLPLILWNYIILFLAGLFFKSAYKKVGHPFYGYRSKVGLFLRRKAVFSLWETSLEAASFVAKTEGEEIMRAVDVNKVYDFVVKDEKDLPVKEQTVFKVKLLSPTDKAALDDNIYKVSGAGNARKEQILSGTQRLTILKKCLVGWENFLDEDDKPIAFNSKDVVEMLGYIPPKYHNEIVNFVTGESEATSEE